MTLSLPWVSNCSRAEGMSSRYPGDRHDGHSRWDPSSGHVHRTNWRPLTSARAVVTAWLTSMCGRGLGSCGPCREDESEAQACTTQIISKLQCWKSSTAQNAPWFKPNLFSSSHFTPYSQMRGSYHASGLPFASSFSHSFKALPGQNTELLGPGTKVCTFRSTSLALLMLQAPHSSLKKCHLARWHPPPYPQKKQVSWIFCQCSQRWKHMLNKR